MIYRIKLTDMSLITTDQHPLHDCLPGTAGGVKCIRINDGSKMVWIPFDKIVFIVQELEVSE